MENLDPRFLLLAVPIFLFCWLIATSNRFIALKNHIKESWADIDVQLKRRHDLIPNLVETVKAYATHERAVLERVVEARSQAVSATGRSVTIHQEALLVSALNGLFARVEAYPELKSSSQFVTLQEELVDTEDRIAAARRFYNANVREFNTMIECFPASLIGSAMAMKRAEFFEVDSVSVRAPVTVTFANQEAR